MQGLCGGVLMDFHSEEESMVPLRDERDPKVTIIELKASLSHLAQAWHYSQFLLK